MDVDGEWMDGWVDNEAELSLDVEADLTFLLGKLYNFGQVTLALSFPNFNQKENKKKTEESLVSPMLEVNSYFIYSFRPCELDLPPSGKTAWGQVQYHLLLSRI